MVHTSVIFTVPTELKLQEHVIHITQKALQYPTFLQAQNILIWSTFDPAHGISHITRSETADHTVKRGQEKPYESIDEDLNELKTFFTEVGIDPDCRWVAFTCNRELNTVGLTCDSSFSRAYNVAPVHSYVNRRNVYIPLGATAELC